MQFFNISSTEQRRKTFDRTIKDLHLQNNYKHKRSCRYRFFVTTTLLIVLLATVVFGIRSILVADETRSTTKSRFNNSHQLHNNNSMEGGGGGLDGSSSSNKTSTMSTKQTAKLNTITVAAATTTTSTPEPSIRYELVEDRHEHQQNVIRYVAVMEEEAGKNNKDKKKKVSFAEWIQHMTGPYSSDYATNLTAILRQHQNEDSTSNAASNKFEAYRFETVPVSSKTVSVTPFEFVLVKDNYLARFATTPDPKPFAEYLSPSSCKTNYYNDNQHQQQQSAAAAGCVFQNLGGDAILIAPTDWKESPSSSSSSCYGHLANFVRGASDEQNVQLWQIVAETLSDRLLGSSSSSSATTMTAASSEPVWFSTAGTGVAWLHFRLDSRPKYYLYQPFTFFPSNKI